MNQYVFLLVTLFSCEASPEPAARSSSSTATENMVCVESDLEEDVLFYTWQLIRLSQRRKTHSPFCIIQWGVGWWLRCYVTWGQEIADNLHIFAFFYSLYVYVNTICFLLFRLFGCFFKSIFIHYYNIHISSFYFDISILLYCFYLVIN